MTPAHRARTLLGVLLAALVMLLPACAVLPLDERVRTGDEVDGNPLRQPPGVALEGPRSGDSAEEIVRNFFRAMADPAADFAVARKFLSQDASDGWRPSQSGILVYEGESSMDILARGAGAEGTTGLQVTVGASARLDTRGAYQPENPGSKSSMVVLLRREQGEWRISQLPDDFGLWLSRADFERTFALLNVYYASLLDNVVIPDPRWVPLGDGTVTAIARLQAADPPDYLKGAVRTGLPEGSALALDAVQVQNRVATVRLGGDTQARLAADQRALLYAQFTRALVQRGAVSEVRIMWHGAELDRADDSSYRDAGRPPSFQLLRQGEELSPVTIEETSFRPYLGAEVGNRDPGRRQGLMPVMPRLPETWTRASASSDARVVAAVGSGKESFTTWFNGVPGPRREIPGTLTTPSFDDATRSDGFSSAPGVWLASSRPESSQVWWVDLSSPDAPGAPTAIPAPWLGKQQVVSLRVAPDFTRVAMVLRESMNGEYVLAISAIIRDRATGRPVSLAPPRQVSPALYEAQDVTWATSDSMVLLGRTVLGTALVPLYVKIGGAMSAGTPLEGATDVTVRYGLGERNVLVTSASGAVFQRAGNGWGQLAMNAQIITPGE